MNIKVFIAMTMICAASLSACASARQEKPADEVAAEKEKAAENATVDDTVIITGTVKIFGSEPHTYIGIASEDGKTYAVEPSKNDAELRSLQGWRIEFTVRFVTEPAGEGSLYLKDGTVTPLSWVVVIS